MKTFFFALLLGASTYTFAQKEVAVGTVTNDIVLGPLAGNRNLAFGVKYIIEEALQDQGHYLSPDSDLVVNVSLLYFDVKKTSMQLAVYNQTTDATEIIAQAYVVENGKKKKEVTAKGVSKNISTSTLIIDEGGKFSQAGVSAALKKVCIELIEKLKL